MGTSTLKHKLYQGITQNNSSLVLKLLQQNPELINQPTTQDSNSLPILPSTYLNRPEILWILIKLGADLQVMGSSQTSPLMWAARRGHNQCIKILIAAGASMKNTGKFQMTASDFAVLYGKFQTAIIFKSKGSLPTKSAQEFQRIKDQLMTLEVDFDGFLKSLNQTQPNFFAENRLKQSFFKSDCEFLGVQLQKFDEELDWSLNQSAFGLNEPLQQVKSVQIATNPTQVGEFIAIPVRQAWNEQ